ncbi:MAG: universal stress protein [Planctomycetes bacterium]|nr:universal stress protein [Planctomycetota bacterium]
MTIVCGIDGSAMSRRAANAAAALAKRTADSVLLVHVHEISAMAVMGEASPVPFVRPGAIDAERKRLEDELQREGEHLARAYQVEVRTELRSGLPDQELDQAAVAAEAALIVVGSLGRRSGSVWRIGSVADRLSQSAGVSVLVVRDSAPFERWALEDRPLHALLALGEPATAPGLVRAVDGLRSFGACNVAEVQVYDVEHEGLRLGLADLEAPDTKRTIETTLVRDLQRRFGELRGRGNVTFHALPTGHGTADTLAEFAARSHSDLIVVGTHGRGALRRRLQGSVSFGVVALADTNVLVVHPTREKTSVERAPTIVRSCLVATDMSSSSQRALNFALGVLGGRGRLVLLHVAVVPAIPGGLVPEYRPTPRTSAAQLDLERKLAEAELKKLLPDEPAENGDGGALECVTEVIESHDVPQAILDAAERHEVDLVCLGTHGRGRVANAVLGSVARTVSQLCTRPVLLVPPPK